jgi:uncharacterized protein YdhG (YjbR/CyaY superfamily)
MGRTVVSSTLSACGELGGACCRAVRNVSEFYEGAAMDIEKTAPGNIDEYIAGFPRDVQEILEQVRTTIRQAAPDAKETISYQMPTFTLDGKYLVYFAAYRKHIGLYPAPLENSEFKEELSAYASGKGTVKFPLDRPIPFDLIRRLVKFRMQENLGRAVAKGKD